MAPQKNKTRHQNGDRARYSKKKTAPHRRHGHRKPHWIYPGDTCWFKETQQVAVANEDWTPCEAIGVILYTDDQIIYVKRSRDKKNSNKVVHHITCLGLPYVFTDSIHSLTKDGPRKRPEEF